MPSVKKYFNKLTKMSSAEIQFRLQQKSRIELEKVRSKLSSNGAKKTLFIPKHVDSTEFLFEDDLSNINFFGLNEDTNKVKKNFKEIFPTEYNRAINQANEILLYEFYLLGKYFSLPDEIDWNRNPETNQAYPKKHYSTISTGNTKKYGDIKYLWELNRHQFFIELAKAYFLTGDEKYALKIKDFITRWIESNPYKLTVNWTSALESAVRIFSWIWTFYYTKESKIWDSTFKEKFWQSLLLKGSYIEENLSYFFSPYNHLIGELTALTFLGTVIPFSKKMISWRDKYWSELENQIEFQFHEDGFTVEQASYYHHFTLGFYLMVVILRKQNNLPVSNNVMKKLEKAIEFPMYLTRPDGHLPMIGDIDSARSIYFYRPDDMWDLRSFLALGAVLFNRGDMKTIAGNIFEEIFWLQGIDGIERYRQLKAKNPNKLSKAFYDSGYFIMRDGWGESSNYCSFDCGEIAHGVHKDNTPSAAHGHADILSFEIAFDSQPVLIDPGFHTYFGPRDWHRYFRSTKGHNVVEVNGKGQAIHEGPIAWSSVSSPELLHWFSSETVDVVAGKIDRFAGLEKDVSMMRCILFHKPYYFLVSDRIVGENKEEFFNVESFLHFSPGEVFYRDQCVYYQEEKLAILSLPERANLGIEIGGQEPHQGWIASGYGYRKSSPVLKIDIQQVLPIEYGMLFLTQKGRDNFAQFSMEKHSDNVLQFDIKMDNWEDIVLFNPNRELFSLKRISSIQTDAIILKINEKQNELKELFVANVSELRLDNEQKNIDDNAGLVIRR